MFIITSICICGAKNGIRRDNIILLVNSKHIHYNILYQYLCAKPPTGQIRPPIPAVTPNTAAGKIVFDQ